MQGAHLEGVEAAVLARASRGGNGLGMDSERSKKDESKSNCSQKHARIVEREGRAAIF